MARTTRTTHVAAAPAEVHAWLRRQVEEAQTGATVSGRSATTVTAETAVDGWQVVTASSAWLRMVVRYDVRPAGSGSDVASEIEVRLRGWARLLAPLSRMMLPRMADAMERDLQKKLG